MCEVGKCPKTEQMILSKILTDVFVSVAGKFKIVRV